MKKVLFKKDILEPKSTTRCRSCGHRNISPKVREIYRCIKCEKPNCNHCLSQNGDVCCGCALESSFPEKLTKQEIQKINEEREGGLFKRYCLICDLRIYKGLYCQSCEAKSPRDKRIKT